jgi:AcrR family transcriptional regulator
VTQQTPAPSPRSRAATRAALVSAAAALFTEAGSTAIGIDAICARAGFTREPSTPTSARWRTSFFAVYEAKAEATLDRLSHATHTVLAAAPSPPGGASLDGAQADQAISTLLAAMPPDVEWFALRAGFALSARGDAERAATLHRHGEAFRASLTPLLTALAERSGARLSPDPEAAARAVIAAHVGAVLQGPLVDDPERLRHDTVLAAWRGVLAPSDAPTPAPRG